MLPDNNRVLVEIRDVCPANTLGVLPHDHPAKVGVEQPFADTVRVLGSVGVAVVSSVIAAPPTNGTFDGRSAAEREEDLEGSRCGVALVRPQSVIASGDAEATAEVVDDGPNSSLQL